MTTGHQPYSYRDDQSVPDFPDDRPVVVFDGMCVFCSGGARLLMRIDGNARFRLAAAQSKLGAALYRHYGLDPVDYQTFLVIDEGRAFVKSDAWLRICRRLGLPWSILSLAGIVPRALRDPVYGFIARRRYRWFGMRESCFLPDAADRDRFLG